MTTPAEGDWDAALIAELAEPEPEPEPELGVTAEDYKRPRKGRVFHGYLRGAAAAYGTYAEIEDRLIALEERLAAIEGEAP